MSGCVIDYFYVVASVASAGLARSSNSLNRLAHRHEHIISIENTGHFDADVWPAGELAQPGSGATFGSGQLQWTQYVPDLRQNEQRTAQEPIDLSSATKGTETLRSGIMEYTDNFAGTNHQPMVPMPISMSLSIV